MFARLQFIARVNQASLFTHYIRFLRPWSYDIAKGESPSMGLLNVTVWFVQCDSFSDVYCLCMTETSKGNTQEKTQSGTQTRNQKCFGYLWVVQEFNSNQDSPKKSRTGCGRFLPWAGVKHGSLDFAKRKSTMNLSFYHVFVFVWLSFWLDDYI